MGENKLFTPSENNYHRESGTREKKTEQTHALIMTTGKQGIKEYAEEKAEKVIKKGSEQNVNESGRNSAANPEEGEGDRQIVSKFKRIVCMEITGGDTKRYNITAEDEGLSKLQSCSIKQFTKGTENVTLPDMPVAQRRHPLQPRRPEWKDLVLLTTHEFKLKIKAQRCSNSSESVEYCVLPPFRLPSRQPANSQSKSRYICDAQLAGMEGGRWRDGRGCTQGSKMRPWRKVSGLINRGQGREAKYRLPLQVILSEKVAYYAHYYAHKADAALHIDINSFTATASFMLYSEYH
ncbi:hypothetical protein E2C01_035375 [Portunus trituberculatus]|uniref:Uncharacterized protein n=1 Tax=Portunus trituberculatus TaxID=210409 RepID=A0A5B7F5J5_PORTR|nr:hypothetical protein [Portunus trituberculatus]